MFSFYPVLNPVQSSPIRSDTSVRLSDTLICKPILYKCMSFTGEEDGKLYYVKKGERRRKKNRSESGEGKKNEERKIYDAGNAV